MHQRFWSEIPGGTEYVAVGAVYLPPAFTAHYAGDDAGAPDVAITFEVRDGVPECREVRITATDGGDEVRHSGIVGVRIEDALDQAIKNLLLGDRDNDWTHTGRPEVAATAIRESQASRRSRRVVITNALLREVAEVYRSNIGHGPTKAVAEHFGKEHRTATLYVQRARQAGLLPPTGQGKARA